MKPLFEWIKTGLKKRKVKVFLLFLLCASLAWFINQLSQTYTSNATFKITYANVPTRFVLATEPKKEIQVRLNAAGFQFLGYHLNPKQITLDLSKMISQDGKYYLTADQIRIQLEDQLNNYTTLTDFENEAIYFDFTFLASKKVPVEIIANISFAKNYMIDGNVKVLPDSVQITGPKSQIDTVLSVKSKPLSLLETQTSFKEKVALLAPKGLTGTTLSNTSVTVAGSVIKFSEKVIKVPVTVVNLPIDVKVRTFPEVIEVRCQGTLKDLKDLKVEGFDIVADYSKASNETNNRLSITLKRYPPALKSAVITTNEIEFILKRE